MAEVGTACIFFRRGPGGGGGDSMHFFLAGTTMAQAGTACILFYRGPRRRRWGRRRLIDCFKLYEGGD